MDILDYIADLSDKTHRQKSAKELAEYLNAKDLIIFVKDPETGDFLPGLGFCQVLPKSRMWREFIGRKGSLIYRGHFPDAETGEPCPAIAIHSVNDSVAVLVGGTPSSENISVLKQILPVISALLTEEQKVISFAGTAQVAAMASGKSEKLAIALDNARNDLLKILEENSKLLKKIQDRNLELERINSELDSFLYTASHDLKAPVSNIEGLVNELEDLIQGKADRDVLYILKLVHISIEKFKITIQDLTDITKKQRDAEADHPAYVNLPELIGELKLSLSKEIEESGAEILWEGEIKEIHFSRKNLRNIFYNLLSNAIKFRYPGRSPEIRISARKINKYFLLEISDNGLGIKKQSIGKLFTMFRRFHQHVEGSGIGLYIVKRTVENAGGYIEVESEEGKGSVFKVFLTDSLK